MELAPEFEVDWLEWIRQVGPKPSILSLNLTLDLQGVSMWKKYLILGSLSLSLIWLFATVLLGGMTYPSYNHSSQFISELAATGAPYGDFVNYLGFIPTEIFILIFVALVFSALPKTKLMILGVSSIAIYAVVLMIAAFFPCDFECRPTQPSLSHILHMILGMHAYLFAIIGIILLTIDSKAWPNSKVVRVSGWCLGGMAFILLLNFDPELEIVGLIQRTTEISIYSWYLILAFYLCKNIPNKGIQSIQKAHD